MKNTISDIVKNIPLLNETEENPADKIIPNNIKTVKIIPNCLLSLNGYLNESLIISVKSIFSPDLHIKIFY